MHPHKGLVEGDLYWRCMQGQHSSLALFLLMASATLVLLMAERAWYPPRRLLASPIQHPPLTSSLQPPPSRLLTTLFIRRCPRSGRLSIWERPQPRRRYLLQ